MSEASLEVARALRALHDEFELSVRARDAALLVEQVYAEDAILLPLDQPIVRGTAQIAEYWQGMFRIGLRDISLEAVSAKATDDAAVEAGRYVLTIEPESAEALLERGNYLAVHWRGPDGSWRLIASTFCDDASM